MIRNLNKNIDTNLKLMYGKEDHQLFLPDFKNIENEHYMIHDLEIFSDEMVEHDLIKRDKEKFWLTPNGIDISKKGGWLKFLIESKKIQQEDDEYIDRKKQLELKNLELENENFEYKSSLRKQDEKLKELTKKNLILQNKSLNRRFWYFIIGLVIGVISSNMNLILSLFGLINDNK